jgi:DNA-binding NarL/FixJ family response regulator
MRPPAICLASRAEAIRPHSTRCGVSHAPVSPWTSQNVTMPTRIVHSALRVRQAMPTPTGPALLPSVVTEKLVSHLTEPETSAAEELSEREQEVLGWVAQGATNKRIAAELCITERTVKAHVTNIFNKLGVNSRAEAVALRGGLLPME